MALKSAEEEFIKRLEDFKDKLWDYIVQPDAENHRMLEQNARKKKKKRLGAAIRRVRRTIFVR